VSGLAATLGIGAGDVVAVVGAGGKTSLVYRLAAEAAAAGLRVLVTTTTHMGTLPVEVTGPVFVEAEGDVEAPLAQALARPGGRATLLGRRVRADKLAGVSPERVDAWARRVDLVLVEADGARQRSPKVPAPHEPVVPRSTTLLLVVAALDALGAPLDEGRVHRLELVAAAAGRGIGTTMDEDVMGAALRAPDGYLSRAPQGARAAVFLNKADLPGSEAPAERIARGLTPPYDFVAAGSARDGWARRWP